MCKNKVKIGSKFMLNGFKTIDLFLSFFFFIINNILGGSVWIYMYVCMNDEVGVELLVILIQQKLAACLSFYKRQTYRQTDGRTDILKLSWWHFFEIFFLLFKNVFVVMALQNKNLFGNWIFVFKHLFIEFFFRL